ncbi:protease inhibitor I9 family protein [Streptomyces sp. ISL-66]|uniref:protease inhibitor I9 family protein n=1 Tax=Streptomyces sp. ISL-66 TaxID=2819186 RepID=UPI001BED0DF1|nr:protease inhibitor I9 family protein [Streptomyces sp. ISL-66]MBT2467987.1 protease inhibitor I9 family protein [Streptomyces sp. ISL-66]
MRRPLSLPLPILRQVLRPVLAAALLLAPVALAPAAYADQGAGPSAGPSAREDEEQGAYIVTLVPGADPARVMRETGITEARYVYRSAVRGFAANLNDAQLAALRAHPDVMGIEKDGGAVGAPVEPAEPAESVQPVQLLQPVQMVRLWGWGG